MSNASNNNLETKLDSGYDHGAVESKWLDFWLNNKIFEARVDQTAKPYCIILPPPNVTGALHMGHALNGTLQDVLIRYQRMQGRGVLWQPGLDHAGIATQTVVERQLRADGIERREIGREAFLERVWQWRQESGDRIIEQQKRLGASCDWTRLRFTMDEHSSKAVLECFVRLWNEGLIYRGERLINWDPGSQTALSDLEVEHDERDGELWSFAYRVKGVTDQEIVVATTRPETMLGDTGIAVHPEDERYKSLIGSSVEHPFFPQREIPIVADDHVDPEFGTGAVKVTPAHDPNDFAIGTRHNLEFINIFTLGAEINENGGPFQRLDRYAARKAIKQQLSELGWERGSESIRHAVTVSQRSGEVIEPMISRQYFVRMGPMANAAQDAVNNGETRMIPDSWKKTWDHFLDNIEDWCISRQLWWGHRIPVYYDISEMERRIRQDAAQRGQKTEASIALDAGTSTPYVLKTALATLSEDDIRAFSIASLDNLADDNPEQYIQEEDVLDTWFSSALWPFSTLGWPADTKELDYWYPSTVLVTAFDILFFWVARMMMMGIHFMGKVPFEDVVLHAIVRDENGHKMSKTKGNVIDPLDLIEAHGADALRFTLTSMTSLGRDINLDPKRIEGYRHFANKVWNACRFVLRSLDPDIQDHYDASFEPQHPINRWILTDIGRTTVQCVRHMESYQFGAYAQDVYQLIWDRFCDWYIECSKSLLHNEAHAQETQSTLLIACDALLRLLHPLMPFMTEELAEALPLQDDRPVTLRAFPDAADFIDDDAAWHQFATFSECVHAVRAIRGENGLPPNQSLDVLIAADDSSVLHSELWQPALSTLARTKSLKFIDRAQAPKFSGTHAGHGFQVWVDLKGLVDVEGEISRLEKVIQQAEQDRARAEKKLQNPDFVDKAPRQVVDAERNKLQEFSDVLERTVAQLERLKDVAESFQ